jgi:hypothetical protein
MRAATPLQVRVGARALACARLGVVLFVAVVLALATAGCNHSPPEPPSKPVDSGTAPKADAAPPPGGGDDAGEDAALDAGETADDASCFVNPTTYFQIINACTDAQAIDKQVDLTVMNLADGGLQPLP